MKYLIGIDLDGTLLNSNKTIDDYTKDIIRKVINNGHKVVLSTGRSYEGTINYYNELNLNTPMITLHGGVVSFINEEPIAKFIDQSLIYKLSKNLSNYIETAIYNTPNKVYSYNHSDELEYVFNGANSKNCYDFDINNISNKIVNIALAVNSSYTEEFENYFINKDLVARNWGEFNGIAFYDIHLKGVSKASSLVKVLEHYNISLERLITFGDGPNDLEMLKIAHLGVAMKNANLEAKTFAKETTKYDNDNSGVGHHLAQLLKNNLL